MAIELTNVKLKHTENLTSVSYNGTELKVAVVGKEIGFSEYNNIYISFSTDKVDGCAMTDADSIHSFEVLTYIEEYPKGTPICEIGAGTIKPIKKPYYETYLDFCGTVVDVKKVPDCSLEKHTKDLQVGHFIMVKSKNMVFELSLATKADFARICSAITGKERNTSPASIPKIGERIKGRARVMGVLF